jgi:hypothetical protein
MIYRGQPVQGPLLPGVARSDPTRNTEVEERESLEQVRRLGASLLPSPSESTLDLMVRAQHFGLETRLLDWTANPLAALWFACTSKVPPEEAPDDPFVYVHALMADDLVIPAEEYDQDPFLAERTRVLQPRLNNPRLIAQHGWFTLHHYAYDSGRFVALESSSVRLLYEYRILKDARPSMLASLDRLGINARTLFPDLAGLCQYLNWRRRSVA